MTANKSKKKVANDQRNEITNTGGGGGGCGQTNHKWASIKVPSVSCTRVANIN